MHLSRTASVERARPDERPPGKPENLMAPTSVNDSWRTWLLTGSRRPPIDRRRVRGAHRGLKKILVEGMSGSGDRPQYWKNFSAVMVRQAVDEAIGGLPLEHKQVVRLAYFGGLSNREIAQHLDLSVAGVQRRLRHAMATVSEYVERGRTMTYRVLCGMAALLAGRWFGDRAAHSAAPVLEQLTRAGIVVAACVTAGAVLVTNPAAPAQLTQVDRGTAPQVTVSGGQPVSLPDSVQAPRPSTVTTSVRAVEGTVQDAAPKPPLPSLPATVQVPILNVEVPVSTPAIPSPPPLGR